jgi:hypothetical protein
MFSGDTSKQLGSNPGGVGSRAGDLQFDDDSTICGVMGDDVQCRCRVEVTAGSQTIRKLWTGR